jgi:hypothetical protein
MLTPGLAGSLVMMITNALAVNFNSPRAWTGMILSFVFGMLVLASAKSLLTKAIYYVLNSLVIFCVALGSNSIGVASTPPPRISLGIITQAFAETNADSAQNPVDKATLEKCANLSSAVSAAQKAGASDAEILKLIEPCQTIPRDILGGNNSVFNNPGQISGGSNSVFRKGGFFAPW